MGTTMDMPVSFILDGDLEHWRDLFLTHCAPPVSYKAGTVLSQCGKPSKQVYFLLDGLVKAYTSNASGYVRLLGYHKANTLCALDCLKQDVPAVITMEAVTPLKVIPLTLDEIEKMCALEPKLASDIMVYIADVLRLMCFDAESQSICDVATRLANFMCLYMQSNEYEEKQCISMSQDNLASAVNASRIQVARILAQMRQTGCIQIERRRITILDIEALQQMRG